MTLTHEQIQALKAAAEKLKEIGIIHNYSKSVAAQIAFEKAATPQAILSLLADRFADKALIAEQAKRIAKLERALDLARNSNSVLAIRSELEARTVTIKLPPVSFFDFKTGSAFASGAYVNVEAMNKALAAAGITLDVGE